jgi:nitrite reductase/ring-hydroxylating ferredoxin subunit
MLSTFSRRLRSRGPDLHKAAIPRCSRQSSLAHTTGGTVRPRVSTSTLRSSSFLCSPPYLSKALLGSRPTGPRATRSLATCLARLNPSKTAPDIVKMAEFKLRDLTSLKDLKNGDMLEAGVEGFEDGKGKVLLVKLAEGEVHAMNANCTHYGAPLKNGVLTPQGRLTCPWHGGWSLPFLLQSLGKEGSV